MHFLKKTTWSDVFADWQEREATNPDWVTLAKEKGWSDWKSWRLHTADQLDAKNREWSLFQFDDPIAKIPKILMGPYKGWQSRSTEPNTASFFDLLSIPANYQHFLQCEPVIEMRQDLPFATTLIGLRDTESGNIICLDGHHRCTAITIASMDGQQFDFSNAPITIALCDITKKDLPILDTILSNGTEKPLV